MLFAQEARVNAPVILSAYVLAPGGQDLAIASGAYTTMTIGAGSEVALGANTTASGDVLFGAGSLININGKTLTITGTLTIEDGVQIKEGSNNTSGITATGGIIYKRAPSHGSYSYICLPFATNTTHNAGDHAYIYNESIRTNGGYAQKGTTWEHTTTFPAGSGVAVYTNSTSAVSYNSTGILNCGDYTKAVTYTNLDSDDSKNGWNLIGNPYPCTYSIDASYFTLNNALGITAIYYYNGTNYTSSTSIGIPSGNAFFVRATSSGNVSFLKAKKTQSNITFLRTNSVEDIKLSLKGSSFTDNTELSFDNQIGVSDAFDIVRDAYKLFSPGVSEIYTLTDGKQLAINALLDNSTTKNIPVGVTIGTVGTYTISAANNSNYSQILLTDNVTGTVTDIAVNGYTFTSNTTGAIENRFSVQLPEARVTYLDANNQTSSVNVFSNNNQEIIVDGNVDNVKVSDISGNVLYSGSSKTINISNSGVYIVEAISNSSKFVYKVMVQ